VTREALGRGIPRRVAFGSRPGREEERAPRTYASRAIRPDREGAPSALDTHRSRRWREGARSAGPRLQRPAISARCLSHEVGHSRTHGILGATTRSSKSVGPFLGGATSCRRQTAQSWPLDVSAEACGEPSAVGLWAISGRGEAEGDRITSAVWKAIVPRLGARPVWPRWPSGRSSRVRRGSGLPRGRRR
jgi:hypothetical protein